ncbi:hypothetical protein FGIG_11815 [Fasciola gigantica]|uniref:Uncharacterized protein n=1 Tax=Fasciola gigantica TaxID=46835 RepID=A0A504YUI5_FASGI|nr:hypothetical protein FGIG_11815 [Fasciola gigantica]
MPTSKTAHWARQLSSVRLQLYRAHRMARYYDERSAIRHALYHYQTMQLTSNEDDLHSLKHVPLSSAISERLTLLLYTIDCSQAMHLIEKIRSFYPNTRIHMGVESSMDERCTALPDTDWIWNVRDTNQMWFLLASRVTTDLVFVGRNLVDFSAESSLKSLLYSYDILEADIIGGAIRLEPEGKWFAGCYKTSIRNHVLHFQPGHDLSEPPCAYCDYIASPFLTKRDLFLFALKLNATMSGILPHVHLMLQLNYGQPIRDRATRILSCVDIMFHVAGKIYRNRGHGISEISRSNWIPIAKLWSLNQISLPGPRLHRWTCREVEFRCDETARPGQHLIPPCCEEERKECIRWFFRKTESLNISVALFHSDTVRTIIQLMGTTLPWSNLPVLGWDASNYMTTELLLNSYNEESSNCGIKPVSKEKLRVDLCDPIPVQLCEHHWLYSSSVNAYLIGYRKYTPDRLPALINSTRVNLYGFWMITYWNPGAELLNRYETDLFDLYDYNASDHLLGTVDLNAAGATTKNKGKTQLKSMPHDRLSHQNNREVTGSPIHRPSTFYILPQGNIQFDPFFI